MDQQQVKPRRRYNCAWRVCAVAFMALLAPAAALAAESLEYKVKAAFLLNFAKFIEWPPTAFPSPNAPFNICILGDDPFGEDLDQIAGGEQVNGRKITIQRLRSAPAPNVCSVLFIAGSVTRPEIPANLGPGLLTVGEGEHFIRDGGMIAFILENRRVRFDINRAAAENAGLKISSKLLSVAREVEK